jgi:hypothetical protein
MEYLKNKSENFFREIRKIEIYNCESIDYMDYYTGNFPDVNNALFVFDIIPENFSRKIPRKKKDGNYYHEIDINFPLLQINSENVELYQNSFNDKKFAMVLISNTEKTMIGNEREPLTIEVLDNKKDDASGNDEYNLSITGESILNPLIVNL